MDYNCNKLLRSFLIFIIFNVVHSSTVDSGIKTPKPDGSWSKSDVFIDNVKRLLESRTSNVNMRNDRQGTTTAQQKRTNEVKKAMKLKLDFNSHNLQYKLDPDAKRNMTELIHIRGYPVERHAVKTEDGFLLDLHRIPHGRKSDSNHDNVEPDPNRPVVFLQHGFISSACDWVMNFANDSLGFVLADHGYDVWMGNSRGNFYSKRHISLKPDQDQFWDWSFHEMGVYDTPAFLDFILNKTGQPSLYFVGHSQGTVSAFVMFSQKPEYQKKIKLFVGLAPIISLQHMKSPLKYFSGLPDPLIYDIFGRSEMLPHNDLIEALVETYCTENITEWLCNDILFLVAGPDISNLNTSRVQVYMDHTPAGTSVKDLVHLTQMYRQKRFAMYDFGSPAANMKRYGNVTPPAYDVTKVTVPSVLFSGSGDWLADPKDVTVLQSTLPNIKGSYAIDAWSHFDFVWGVEAAVGCYSKILEWLPTFL